VARQSARPSSAIKRILAIDIGGTGLKAAVIGPDGKFLTEHERIKTPSHCTPKKMLKALATLLKPFQDFDRVSIGFPGYVRDGIVFTAPHLATEAWAGFKFAAAMEKKLKRPGKGLELVCTLGTGFGTAWFRDGELMPHMDLAHMAVHPKHDFDDYLGDVTLKKIGNKSWNKRVKKTVIMLNKVFFYDHLYFGGGNSRLVKVKLPKNVSIVSNDAGMEGGAFVWLPKGPKESGPKKRN